jgi:hypothetical protein
MCGYRIDCDKWFDEDEELEKYKPLIEKTVDMRLKVLFLFF